MKKIITLLFVFSFFCGFKIMAQCDCMSYYSNDIFTTKKGITQKNYKARFSGNPNKKIQFTIILEKNKKYTFETYDKKGRRTERIKVDILSPRREVIRNNIDLIGNVKEKFFLYPPEKSLVYMELSVLKPENSHCTCAYVVMFVDDL